MMGPFTLLPNDSSMHTLLEPPSPAYTTTTIRRAFIVWLHSGQQNEFRHVCNYFHHLESLEEKLAVEQRATSRMHEFNLLANYPPKSDFLTEHFPKLYQHNKYNKVDIKEVHEVTLEDNVFKLEGYHNMKIRKGTTAKDIIKASQMIRSYCKTHSKSLKVLLAEFQDCAKKIKATNNVDNIIMYIRKKYLTDELVTWNNLPKSFSFLELDEAEEKDYCVKPKVLDDTKGPILAMDHTMHVKNKNATKLKKMLVNGARRRQLFSMIPDCKDVAEKLNEEIQYEKAVFYDYVHKMNKER